MALEFNADKEIIKSDQLKIKNDTSVKFDLGGGADEKVALFGTLSADVDKLVRVGINTASPNFELDVNGQIRTTTSIISDTARINNLDIDTIVNDSLNLKAPILNSFTDPNTGQVLFPRSTTPAFNDDSNKIATTNFVYNIATNDVGGRIYVSAQIGSDSFDGRSATKPVATIKRATQLAAETTDRETLIVAGGDYLEDNPISLPDLCSVVGDNIRLCVVRPQNPGKHMFKASNENYVTGITFRDQIDGNGVAIKTWSFAYVFDDKQRFFYPKSLGGQYGRTFNLGHTIQAAQKWSLKFTSNGGGTLLVPGLTLTNTTTSGSGVISEVNFDANTDQTGTVVIENISGLIESTGATYTYVANNPQQTYNLTVSIAEQLTPDAQVVKHVTTHATHAVQTVQSDLNAYPDGMIIELNVYHEYEVGQYVSFENFPSSGTFADLNRLNGRQYVSHRIETADGFSKKFVVFKDTPIDLTALGASNGTYNATVNGVTVTSDDHYVVFSLNNSPIKFEESVKSPNRYLDAVDLIGKNREGIAAEALRRAKAEYTALVVPDEAQCKTDIGHIVNAINYDLTWGGNAATKEAADYYYDAGALTHIEDQLKETTYAFEQARDLSIQAMRNQLKYVDTSSSGSFTRPTGYTGTYQSATWDNNKFIVVGASGAIHTSTDGTNYTAQTTGTTEQLNDVIFNKWAVGERGVPEYVVVGANGTILHSNDAVTWYSKTSGVSTDLRAVAYSGNTYVVVGNAGTVLTSQNVTSWISRTSGTTENLLDVIYNDDVDKFIAIGASGTILESSDGITWSAQESGTSEDLYGITWSEGRTVIAGDNGTLIISDDGGLTWETNILTTNVEADRYQDAADLILKNKKLIAAQAVFAYVDANSFTIPTGNQNCVDDVVDVIEAIAHDLRHGNNAKSYDAASYYVGTTHVDGEEAETVAIINNARDLAKDAMRNISITLSYLNNNTFTASLESQFTSGIEQFKKPDISLDGNDPTTACANVASSIDTLASIVTTAVTNDNLNHATRTVPTGSWDQAIREISHDGNRFWASGSGGGTQKIYVSEDRGRTWTQEYSNSGSQHLVLAFSYDVAIVAGDNGNDFTFDGVGNEFDASINIAPFQDETISNTYDANRFFACDNVANSLFTLWNIVIDRINGRTVAATTNATSAFVDSNNKFFNVGHAWDDLPIIEVSPYIFNASVISFLGGSGCEIDGNKVATPNVKRPNLPPQGKSMVAAAFTIISFGGTGYDVFNDGYTQLVSVFCIFTQDGALVRSGGYASLTNSASNFGTFSLRSSGVREEAYSFDKGIIDNVSFDDINRPEITISGLGTKPLEHYIFAPGGFEVETLSGSNPRVFNELTKSSSGGNVITAEILLNKANTRLRGNFNRYTDAATLIRNNVRYIAEEAYFSTAATSTNSFDQNRDKCIRDVEEILKAWANDIQFDSNDSTWDAAKLYVSGNAINHIAGYEAATKEVIDTATTLAKKAINNLLQKKGDTATSGDYHVALWTDEVPYVDTTITHDISSAGGNYVSGDCANVQSAIQTLSDLFDEIIDNPTVTTPMPSTTTRDDGFFTLGAVNKAKLVDHEVDLLRPSICNSSSHTWEFAGSGNDYNALPQNGGTRGSDNTEDFEQVSQLNGRVYASGTDELGDFKIGYFANVENRTGNITFGGTVEISEVSFLKITGNNLIIEGFSADNTLGSIALGGPGASDNLLPTQKAVKDYISNQLGAYIGRTYSTVPTPGALVQLDGSGRINIDQLPALRPFNIFTVADQAARLALEGPLAGDIVIQQDTTISFILNNDLESQILEFVPNSGHSFASGNITTASPGGGQGQVTQFLEGTVRQVIVNNGGTGYANGDTITFSTPSGGTAATGTLTVNGGQITGVTITSGGDNYFTAPSTAAGTISITTSTGSNAVITTSIRSRLYIDIINSIKTVETDTIQDQANPANTITLTSAINTSGSNANNWVQLTSSTIDASFITTGVINPARLANITAQNPANDLTYLRGDSVFAEAVSSMRINDDSPVVIGSQNSDSDYIKEVQIEDGGSGYTVGSYTEQAVTGGNAGSGGLKATYRVADGVVQKVTMTNQGTGYDAANPPTVLFKDTWTTPSTPQVINSIIGVPVINASGNITDVYLKDGGSGLGSNVPTIEFEGGGGVDAAGTATVSDGVIRTVTVTSQGFGFTSGFNVSSIPSALGSSPNTAANLFSIFATVPKVYNDVFVDIRRVDGNTAASDQYGKLGVARFKKSQYNFLSDGAVELKTGNASGLDADLLDGLDSTHFTDATNITSGTLNKDRLPGEISSNTTGNAATSGKVNVTDAKTSIFSPSNFGSGFVYQLKDNNDSLNYGASNEYLDDGGLYHGVTTFRRGGASNTFSDGAITQHANTDNGNLFLRNNGVNRVASLSITTAGAGYVNGTYSNILLGGGEGYGLRANLTVSGGAFTNVELVDGGWGYNQDGSATQTFSAILPYEYFGEQNTRNVTTVAVITATLPAYVNFASVNTWSQWRKVWHDGNDGVGSGLDADLFQAHNLRWFNNPLNLNYDAQLMTRKIPTQLDEHAINKELRITVPSPAFQTNTGGHYDIYINGHNLTSEVVAALDTDSGSSGTQLNLYTANNVNEGTVRVIARRMNLDPANYETGSNFVESNTEWSSGLSGLDRNDRVVYGHNVYKVANASTGNYTAGTVAPVHISGQVTATGGTAIFEFERKVENPWTILTVELTSGNLTRSIRKIGTATAPAEYYPVTEFGVTGVETYSRQKARLGSDSNGYAFLELGNSVESTTPYIDFNSSGNNVDYDVRLISSSGSSSVGTGILNTIANNAQVNGNNIWHAGNITFSNGITANAYDSVADGKGVIRDSNGNIGVNRMYGDVTGVASGNLPLTGGALTGNLTMSNGTEIALQTASGNARGHLQATETDGQHLIIATSGGEDIAFKDGGLSGTTNMVIQGDGRVGIGRNPSFRLDVGAETSPFQTIARFGSGGSDVLITHSSAIISHNSYYNGGWKSTGSGKACLINFQGGQFEINMTGGSVGGAEQALNFNLTPFTINNSGYIGINGSADTNFNLKVNGPFAATSKSFVIDHPTKEDYQLVYGSLEGPEHGVYVRGKVTDGVIELPDYWSALVDEDTITVQLTAIGDSGNRWVVDVADNKVTTGGGAAFYFVQAERKDIDKLTVEVEVVKEEKE